MPQTTWELIFLILSGLFAPFLAGHAQFDVDNRKESMIELFRAQAHDGLVWSFDTNPVFPAENSFSHRQSRDFCKALSLLTPCPCVEDLLIETCLMDDAEELFTEPPSVETLLYNEVIKDGEQSKMVLTDHHSESHALDSAAYSALRTTSSVELSMCRN